MIHNDVADTKVGMSGIYLLVALILCNIALVAVTKAVFYDSSYTVTKEKQPVELEHGGQHWNSLGFNLAP